MINSMFFLLLLFHQIPALAYIGPGMGGGVIAAIFGIISAFLLGLWGILYYPIKRAIKNKKKKKINTKKSLK